MKKKLKVLIPNATSPKNIGDLAMLTSLINLLGKEKSIIVHSVDPTFHRILDVQIKPTMYYWAVLSVKNPFIRMYRMALLIVSILFNIGPQNILNQISDYRSADVIFFVGGGYLRSNKGIDQSLNFLMQLVPFIIAGRYKSKKIVSPISFGPYAYDWQAKLAASVLGKCHFVSVREKISYDYLKNSGLNSHILSTDHALLLKGRKSKKKSVNIIGFTLRNWGTSQDQKKLEDGLVEALLEISKKRYIRVQPIIQVDAPQYGDEDLLVSQRVSRRLKKIGICVLPIKKNNNLKHALMNYDSVDLLIGMRMHSNILAALMRVPFIGIAYEHKTEGISNELGLGAYVLNVHKVNRVNLVTLIESIIQNYTTIVSLLDKSVSEISLREKKRWDIVIGDILC